MLGTLLQFMWQHYNFEALGFSLINSNQLLVFFPVLASANFKTVIQILTLNWRTKSVMTNPDI